MFTIDIIIGILKRFVGFLWEYKYTILISMIITALYIRGNNYKQDYVNENVAHVKTILEYDQQINDIRLANETALRIAQEESTANYKALVEKTSKIQQEYSQREEDINTTITKLNSSNNSLSEQIRSYTSNSNPDSSKAEQEIPQMPIVYKSQVNYLKLVQEENNTMLKKLQNYPTQ